MAGFTLRTRIRRAPEDVFRLLTSFDDVARYVKEVTSVEKTTPGELAAGTEFVQRGRFAGRAVEVPTVVTTYEPPTRFGYRTDAGPLPYEARYALMGDDGGTVLDTSVTLLPRRLPRAVHPLLVRLVRAAYARNLERMRRLLEAGGAAR